MFELVMGVSEYYTKKPDAEVLKRGFCQYGINLSEVLMVGDTLIDLQTAENRKIDFCGAIWDNIHVKRKN